MIKLFLPVCILRSKFRWSTRGACAFGKEVFLFIYLVTINMRVHPGLRLVEESGLNLTSYLVPALHSAGSADEKLVL